LSALAGGGAFDEQAGRGSVIASPQTEVAGGHSIDDDEQCGRYGRYDVKRLIAVHGADAKLTELLLTLANCEKARSVSLNDRCQARFDAGFRRRT
jgi:hypothetical protein